MREERDLDTTGGKGKANHASIPAKLQPQYRVRRNNKMLDVYEPLVLESIAQQ